MFSQLKTSPLLLLLRVNATHSWRRLLAVRDQSRLLTSIIGLFIVCFVGFFLSRNVEPLQPPPRKPAPAKATPELPATPAPAAPEPPAPAAAPTP